MLFHGLVAASCSFSTSTVSHPVDTSAFLTSATLTGSLVVATDAVGDIALDNIETLEGSLLVQNAPGVREISASGLRQITGNLSLDDLTALTNVSLPMIEYASNLLIWDTALERPDGLPIRDALSLEVSDNAVLTSVSIPVETWLDIS